MPLTGQPLGPAHREISADSSGDSQFAINEGQCAADKEQGADARRFDVSAQGGGWCWQNHAEFAQTRTCLGRLSDCSGSWSRIAVFVPG